jgi:hypothetical protein
MLMDDQSNPIQWLLEDNNPSLQFRTLKELLNYDDEAHEIRRAKFATLQSIPVQTLFEKMHHDGYCFRKILEPKTSLVTAQSMIHCL